MHTPNYKASKYREQRLTWGWRYRKVGKATACQLQYPIWAPVGEVASSLLIQLPNHEAGKAAEGAPRAWSWHPDPEAALGFGLAVPQMLQPFVE